MLKRVRFVHQKQSFRAHERMGDFREDRLRWDETKAKKCTSFIGKGFRTKCSPFLGTKEVLRLHNFVSRSTAKRIIELFNAFSIGPIRRGFRLLFEHFIWGPNGMTKDDSREFLYFHRIVSSPERLGHSRYDHPPRDENDVDSVRTAATDGDTLWINTEHIMNEDFNLKKTHFGLLPDGVSHFSAVMLHEFGHILRSRANSTTFLSLLRQSPDVHSCFDRYQQQLADAREGPSRNAYDDVKNEMEEWIADMFAKSFIEYATEWNDPSTRLGRPPYASSSTGESAHNKALTLF